MNCKQAKQHWHLFHDSEGDAELHHQINEHLAMCPDCARWYFQQSRLEDALVDRLRVGAPSRLMWDRIQAHCVDQRPAAQSSLYAIRTFGLAALLLVAIVSLVWYSVAGIGLLAKATPDLADLSVELHENLASGREALKLYSQFPQEVEDYVRKRVSFPMRCPPRGDAGFEVAGGGVCYFEKDPVAYVIGDVDGQRVSVLVMARESLKKYPAQEKALRHQATLLERRGTCGVVIGELDRNLVLVVGQVDSSRLTRVLTAYGSYPNHEAGAALPIRSDGLAFTAPLESKSRGQEALRGTQQGV